MEFKIPPLPTTLGEVLQILSRETPVPDDRRLVEIIEKDPAISIYVLRQVNSAYYGLRRHVTEIRRAVSLLGLKRVCNLVLAASLKQTFAYLENPTSQTIYEHVIRGSVATAAFARDLTAYLRLPLAEMAFTAGLLHQIGRLVFLYSAPHLYVPLWYPEERPCKNATPEAPSRETEHLRFNTDYLRLGASTLRKWKLPGEFATVTNCLHAPQEVYEGPLRPLTLTIAASMTVAASLFDPPSQETADDTDTSPLEIPPYLAELAQAQNIESQALIAYLNERQEPIAQFAQSVLSDL